MAEIAYHYPQSAPLSEERHAYYPRFFVFHCLPHSKPKDSTYSVTTPWGRVTFVADPEIGLPYGTIPRLMIAHIASTITYNKNKHPGDRTIELPHYFKDYQRQLALETASGHGKHSTAKAVRNQLTRLLYVAIHLVQKEKDHDISSSATFTERADIWHNTPTNQPHRIVLSPIIYDELSRFSFPFEAETLKNLRRSPLALDLYFWLVYRLHGLSRHTTVPYHSLYTQFYANPNPSSQDIAYFRYLLRKHLPQVTDHYPDAHIELSHNGIVLHPSPSLIPSTPTKQTP